MDRRQYAKKGITIYHLLGVGAAISFAVGFLTPVGSQVVKQGRFLAKATTDHKGIVAKLKHRYGEKLLEIETKLDHIRRAEMENTRLRLENAHLKLELEALKYRGHTAKAEERTEALRIKLSQETGSSVGRTLASMTYKLPAHLLPSQLHVLAASYMDAEEWEKAAVIFTSLAEMEGQDEYKTSREFVSAGVCWYKLENYELAERYFDKALKAPGPHGNLRYHAHARLWKAVLAKHFKKDVKAQYWLHELLDHHPHSTEAAWVNRQEEVERAPAKAH